MSMLFSPYQIKNVTLKNRIVMSPMCMLSSTHKDGRVTEWHRHHYTARAIGQVGLIFTETVSIHPQGKITPFDLGIWDDEFIEGLKSIVDAVHENGSKIGIQIGHAGRKADVDGFVIAPSAIPFNKSMKTPMEMSADDIKKTVERFKEAAIRAKAAGFDVIEVHGAHGYLVSQFLSPLSNKRPDKYSGSRENRYRFLREVLEAINSVWKGPLFVRLSISEYHPEGNTLDDMAYFCREMKKQRVDLVDCSSGGIVNDVKIDVYPGYQVTLAEEIRKQASINTGAVGLITHAIQAEEILKNKRADLIFVARELLRDPYWPLRAAQQLGVSIQPPFQYKRAWDEVLVVQNSVNQRWVPGKR